MSGTAPDPGNPWPHDMSITIEDDAFPLMELLWVREAWDLHPPLGGPPRLARTPARIGEPEDRTEWETAWPGLWAGAVQHAASAPEPALFAALTSDQVGSDERASLVSAYTGPTWSDRFGAASLGTAFDEWNRAERERRLTVAAAPQGASASPEHLALDALIPAWEAGLTRVVTIPCRGNATRIISDTALLVTEATRRDPIGYVNALRSFAEGQPGSR